VAVEGGQLLAAGETLGGIGVEHRPVHLFPLTHLVRMVGAESIQRHPDNGSQRVGQRRIRLRAGGDGTLFDAQPRLLQLCRRVTQAGQPG